jgi:hypothetical protein
MRKFATALAFIFSASLASAQEAKIDDVKVTPAAQSTAYKAGAWLGSALQTPISAGTSFFAGLVAKPSPTVTKIDSSKSLNSAASTVSEFPDSKTSLSVDDVDKTEVSPALTSPLENIRSQVFALLAEQQRKHAEALASGEKSVQFTDR